VFTEKSVVCLRQTINNAGNRRITGTFFSQHLDNDINIRYNIYIKVSEGDDYMENEVKLKMISDNNGGIISTNNASESGISRMMLLNLCKNGIIVHIAHGQYILANEIQDEMLSVSMRSKNIIFSHETALFLHGISDRTPFEHTITYPSGKVPSPALRDVCKIYFVKPELFDMGKTELTTPMGNQVIGYDLERTICDIVRSRNKVGTETFHAAMKMYVKRKDKDFNKLYLYAKELRVQKIINNYLEVLL